MIGGWIRFCLLCLWSFSLVQQTSCGNWRLYSTVYPSALLLTRLPSIVSLLSSLSARRRARPLLQLPPRNVLVLLLLPQFMASSLSDRSNDIDIKKNQSLHVIVPFPLDTSAHTVHTFFMHHALHNAQMAAQRGEVPVGALVVRNRTTSFPPSAVNGTYLFLDPTTVLAHDIDVALCTLSQAYLSNHTSTNTYTTSNTNESLLAHHNQHHGHHKQEQFMVSLPQNQQQFYEVLSSAGNRVEEHKDASAHAEMLALREAAQRIGNWRLMDCVLYSTLEPCPMCCSAALAFRIHGLIYGAPDFRLGAIHTTMSMLQTYPHPFHTIHTVVGGIEQNISTTLLQDFFRQRRRQQQM